MAWVAVVYLGTRQCEGQMCIRDSIYASAYQLYLPNKALLQAKVKEWIEEFEAVSYTHLDVYKRQK